MAPFFSFQPFPGSFLVGTVGGQQLYSDRPPGQPANAPEAPATHGAAAAAAAVAPATSPRTSARAPAVVTYQSLGTHAITAAPFSAGSFQPSAVSMAPIRDPSTPTDQIFPARLGSAPISARLQRRRRLPHGSPREGHTSSLRHRPISCLRAQGGESAV